MTMSMPTWQDAKNTAAFTGFGFCAITLGKLLIETVGKYHAPVTNTIINFTGLGETGRLLLSTSYVLPVMLASQFMKLVDPKSAATSKDAESPIKAGGVQVKPNYIGHLMNNAARGLVDYAPAVVVMSHAHNMLKSQSTLASNQWLLWGIVCVLGGTTAKLFDSKCYKPYLEERISFLAHKVGNYYEDASNTVHTFIGM